VNIGNMWTKNRKYRQYIGIADIFSSKISISYRFWKSGIDPSLNRITLYRMARGTPARYIIDGCRRRPNSIIEKKSIFSKR